MKQYKKDFIDFLVRTQALAFGDFTLKSGRKCPYFLNIGKFHSGESIAQLGTYYAHALKEHIQDYDIVFGPAYKGIPISVATVIALAKEFNFNASYSFNRKEAKDHGEGGMIVGAPITPESKLVILDDVMTAGTALRESFDLLTTLGSPHIAGVVIAVDRMEKGKGDKSALEEVKEEFGIHVYSIVTLQEIIDYLYKKEIDGQVYLDDEKMAKIYAYRKEYGVNVF